MHPPVRRRRATSIRCLSRVDRRRQIFFIQRGRQQRAGSVSRQSVAIQSILSRSAAAKPTLVETSQSRTVGPVARATGNQLSPLARLPNH